jgi:hypothetical protein
MPLPVMPFPVNAQVSWPDLARPPTTGRRHTKPPTTGRRHTKKSGSLGEAQTWQEGRKYVAVQREPNDTQTTVPFANRGWPAFAGHDNEGNNCGQRRNHRATCPAMLVPMGRSAAMTRGESAA